MLTVTPELETLELTSFNAAGKAPFPNNFFSLPEHDRKKRNVELVDKVVPEQGLQEVGRALGQQVRPFLAFQLLHCGDCVGAQRLAVLPVQLQVRISGRDIFGDAIEKRADRIVGTDISQCAAKMS